MNSSPLLLVGLFAVISLLAASGDRAAAESSAENWLLVDTADGPMKMNSATGECFALKKTWGRLHWEGPILEQKKWYEEMSRNLVAGVGHAIYSNSSIMLDPQGRPTGLKLEKGFSVPRSNLAVGDVVHRVNGIILTRKSDIFEALDNNNRYAVFEIIRDGLPATIELDTWERS